MMGFVGNAPLWRSAIRDNGKRCGTAQGLFPIIGLPDYLHRFKTLTTKLYADGVRNGDYPPFDKKVWQKSYHDHIIHNKTEYKKIWEYIEMNPIKWQDDCFNDDSIGNVSFRVTY